MKVLKQLNKRLCVDVHSVEHIPWSFVLNPKSLNAGQKLLLMTSQSYSQTQQILCGDVGEQLHGRVPSL